ncbi:MAG TPA: hypothetical protein VFL77_07690 [Solirubrobacterales bacterium]|nr:hypothetical protein [Solirubrobacterales bacterium]
MRYIKTLGLAAMALAAMMALAGTASATILTSPAGTTYTSTVKAVNSGKVTLTSAFGGFGAVECEESVVEGKVEGHGSTVTVTGEIATLTFAKCTGGTPRSPVGVAANSGKRGSLEVHTELSTANGNGTVTSKGAEVIIDNTLFGTCTFTTSASGTDIGQLTGSDTGNAHFDIHGSIASPCGTGTWEGNYTIVTPSTLTVD